MDSLTQTLPIISLLSFYLIQPQIILVISSEFQSGIVYSPNFSLYHATGALMTPQAEQNSKKAVLGIKLFTTVYSSITKSEWLLGIIGNKWIDS